MSWRKFNFKSVSRSWHVILLVIWQCFAWAFYRWEWRWVWMKTLQLSTGHWKNASVLVWIQLKLYPTLRIDVTVNFVLGELEMLPIFSVCRNVGKRGKMIWSNRCIIMSCSPFWKWDKVYCCLIFIHTLPLNFLFCDWFFSKYAEWIENVHCTPRLSAYSLFVISWPLNRHNKRREIPKWQALFLAAHERKINPQKTLTKRSNFHPFKVKIRQTK